jgi:UDP-N-acetylglucosamine 1-carboxyvinyltransferase
MDKLVIHGGKRLSGSVSVSGAKNAVLPAMAAALLTTEKVVLENVPQLRDVATMARLLRHLGATVEMEGDRAVIDASGVAKPEAPYDLVRTMRASFEVLGPLLARFGSARVSLPGGCAIGARPINIHLTGLAAMGAEIDLKDGYVEAKVRGLKGANIVLDIASVGATRNLMMAATLASGTTVINNAAREPEVSDLAALLVTMGARIKGAGTDVIRIEGVRRLGGSRHRTIPDRIEAASYLAVSVLTGGGVTVKGAVKEHLAAFTARLAEAGMGMESGAAGLVVKPTQSRPKSTDAVTAPYPGFATDMQAQWTALMTVADGSAVIRETLFENRFQHVPELVRMGADITVKGATAVVRGVSGLKGAPVMVSDLRAGMALVIAALAAEGTTEIHRIYHLDRGYEKLVEKLSAVGASIERVPGPAI